MIIADCIDELQPYIDDVLPDDEEIDTMDVACQVDVTEYLEQVAVPMLEGWMATGELLVI